MKKWRRFCFVHTADLHLDSPFYCLRASSEPVAQALREATFQAWEQVIAACLEHRAAFLLVAGDVFDSSLKSLRAQLRFHQGLERLARESIAVFVACGNHDPRDSWPAWSRPPDNTWVFGEQAEARQVRRDGELLAVVTGISHPHKNETRDLTALFPPPAGPDAALQVAVLHANAGGQTGHEPYAPCEIEDLAGRGYHYWALGHVHRGGILRRDPWIVYPGNTQGRHLRETGPRGCYLVQVEDGAIAEAPRFVETDAVRWLEQEIDAEGLPTTQELLEAVTESCRRLQQQGGGRPVAARLTVRGRTPLYGELRRLGHLEDLQAEARDRAAALDPFVWLAELNFQARPPLDLEALRNSPDFLGELLGSSEALTPDDCRQEWENLFRRLGGPRLVRALAEDWDPTELALEARYLCADLLSPEAE